MDEISRTFGRDAVDPQARRARIRAVFQDIAPRYDLMNDLMSGGMHRLWKARFADRAAGGGGGPVVDLAGGTGDIAMRILKRDRDAAITICDPSTAMLGVAAKRHDLALALAAGEGEDLPFAADSIATVTLAFGLRNMTEPTRAIGEIFRVLRPGGRLLILEFSQPDRWFAPFYGAFSRLVIPTMGAIVTRNGSAYRYLVESIAGFPDPVAVNRTLENTGFRDISVERLFFGVAAIHIATKPET